MLLHTNCTIRTFCPVLNGKYLVLHNIALAGVELWLETAHKGQGVMYGPWAILPLSCFCLFVTKGMYIDE